MAGRLTAALGMGEAVVVGGRVRCTRPRWTWADGWMDCGDVIVCENCSCCEIAITCRGGFGLCCCVREACNRIYQNSYLGKLKSATARASERLADPHSSLDYIHAYLSTFRLPQRSRTTLARKKKFDPSIVQSHHVAKLPCSSTKTISVQYRSRPISVIRRGCHVQRMSEELDWGWGVDPGVVDGHEVGVLV